MIIFSKLPSTFIFVTKKLLSRFDVIIPIKGRRKHNKIKSVELRSVFNKLTKLKGKSL